MTATAASLAFLDHDPAPAASIAAVRLEKRSLLDPRGAAVPGLCNAWIWLDNPRQFNSYTTRALADLILALRRVSNDPEVAAVVLTAVGDKAFCTGGNTAEYSQHYAGRPDEYRRYMRLFNDAVSALLECDKPVINRVNGMRIGGGQELGMACDFTLAADTARFGQAGPKHGSAPIGGATDFLPLYVGWARAAESCTLCEPWTAHQALGYGLINGIAPVTLLDGKFIPNPLVVTEARHDAWGRPLWGTPKTGAEKEAARELLGRCTTSLELLDREVEAMAWKLANTMPDCTTCTLESLRRHKLAHWDRNREGSRAWLALNMMTEGLAGFRTFHRAPRERREADFLELRRALAQGGRWGDPEFLRRFAPFAGDGTEDRR